MVVTFYQLVNFKKTPAGTVTWEGGALAIEPENLSKFLRDVVVVEPNNPGHRLTPADGPEFVKALPANFHGSYSWAELTQP